jgi:K+-transporting ATPase c subunit
VHRRILPKLTRCGDKRGICWNLWLFPAPSSERALAFPAWALQVARVANRRGFDAAPVRNLSTEHTQGRWLGATSEPGVGVLDLNFVLDALK